MKLLTAPHFAQQSTSMGALTCSCGPKTGVAPSRRGITLLEVLISMFVALVGLAGLAALFWVGGVEMGEGAKADRALSVARAAHRTFRILGMHRPVQTFTYTGGGAGVPQTIYAQTWWYPVPNTPGTYYPIDGSKRHRPAEQHFNPGGDAVSAGASSATVATATDARDVGHVQPGLLHRSDRRFGK